MDLSPSAWSGTEGSVCEWFGFTQTPRRLTAEIFGTLLCAKESTDAFCSAWAGRYDLNKPFVAPSLVILKGERKCYSLHTLSEMVWKTSTASLPKKLWKEPESRVQLVPVRIAGEEMEWSSLEVFKN